VDAKDQVLGRLATRIARILQGKHKATFTPNFLCGDKVVVINASQIKVTGNKVDDKVYDWYSGYHSGRHEITYKQLLAKNPGKIIYVAVKGMLPRTLLAKRMIRGLKVYPGEKHEQAAQKPEKVVL